MQSESVQESIEAEVLRRIAVGVYLPGARLPNQRELAREFGTSPTTVSRALRAVERRGFVTQKRGVGIRMLPLSERPSFGSVGIFGAATLHESVTSSRILQGVKTGFTRWQQHFQVAEESPGSPHLSAQAIVARYSGALFIQGIGFDAILEELEARHFPFVVASLETDLPVTCTWVDHGKSTRTAVRLLAAMGHRRIGLVTRPPRFFFYAKAIAGYRETVAELGLDGDPALEVHSPPADADGAYAALRAYLADRPSPSAWVAARDYLAGGACRALTERGMRIGRDVSVIGFDDTSWPHDPPFLTTFAEPNVQSGVVAAEMLVARLISGWRTVERREVEAPLLMRASVGPASEPGDNVPREAIPLQTWKAAIEEPAMTEQEHLTAIGGRAVGS